MANPTTPLRTSPGCCCGCPCGETTIDVELSEPGTSDCGDCSIYAGTYTLTKWNSGDDVPTCGLPSERPIDPGDFVGVPYSSNVCYYYWEDETFDHCNDTDPVFTGTGLCIVLVADPGEGGSDPELDVYISTGQALDNLFRVDNYFTDGDCTNTETATLYDWPATAYNGVRVFYDLLGTCPGAPCCQWAMAEIVTINP